MGEENGQGNNRETVGFAFVSKMVDLAFVEEEFAGASRVWILEVSGWGVVTNVHVGDVGFVAANRHESAFKIHAAGFDRLHFSAG